MSCSCKTTSHRQPSAVKQVVKRVNSVSKPIATAASTVAKRRTVFRRPI